MASITMEEVIDDSFHKKEAPKVQPTPSPAQQKNSILESSFNALKEQGRKLSDIIIQDRQRESMASLPNPYLVQGLIDPPKPILKKRGRPKKTEASSVGSTTPDRTVSFDDVPRPRTMPTPPPSPKRPTPPPEDDKTKNRDRHNTIIRIEEYIKLYPNLVAKGIAPPLPHDFTRYSDDQLAQLYKDCKEHGSSSSTGQLEYQLVSSTFYKILDNFETICYFASIMFPVSVAQNPITHVLGFLSRQPRGSFSSYIHKCILAGDDMDKDLREISIQLIGYLPDSPYSRLALKLAYHAYDYSRFQMDSALEANMKRTQEAVNQMTAEQMMMFSSMMSSTNDQ
jgi:hypothetical protein